MQASKIQAGFAALSIVVLLMTACGGGGGGGTTTGTSTVLSAYVANYGDGTILQYTVNPSTGALMPKSPATICAVPPQTTPCTNYDPQSITVDPAGKYAYVANSLAGISQFTIGPGGVLQPMNPATVPWGSYASSPTSVAIDPSGKYLYAVNSAGSEVAQFIIDPTNGTLTSMSTPTVCTFSLCALNASAYAYITVDPTGNYVYVADQGNNLVEEFSIGSGGGLTYKGSVATGTSPISIAIDPADNNAYVVNYGNPSTITQYSIASGLLTSKAITGGAGTQLVNATSITIDHSGSFAYVASGSGLFQLPITSVTGTLSIPSSVAAIWTGGTPVQSVAIDASGKFVFVANQSSSTYTTGSVSQFSIGAGGALSNPVETPAGNQAYFITTAASIQ